MPFPVDVSYVRATEERLGVRFPSEYVVRMVRNNGGELETDVDGWDECWTLHPIYDDGDRTRLKRTCNDVVRETEALRELDWFPAEAVCIGANGGGDHLILQPSDSDATQLGTMVLAWSLDDGESVELGDTSELF